MKRIKLYLLAIAVTAGIGAALAFKAQSQYFTGSNNTFTTETWVSTGHTAQDQDDNHYITIIGSYHCQDVPVVCTYIKINGKWVQWERGLFTQP